MWGRRRWETICSKEASWADGVIISILAMNSGVSQRYRNLPRESILNEHGFIRDVLEKGRFLGDEHFPLAEKIFRRFLKKV